MFAGHEHYCFVKTVKEKKICIIPYVYEFRKDGTVILKIAEKVGRDRLPELFSFFLLKILSTLSELPHSHARSCHSGSNYHFDIVHWSSFLIDLEVSSAFVQIYLKFKYRYI